MELRLATRIAGTLGASVSLLTIFGLGILTPGHDMIHSYISTLGVPGEAYAGLYVVGGGVASALSLTFLLALGRENHMSTLLAAALTLLSAFFVLHFIAATWLPCTPGCDWSTPTSQLHYASGFAAFVAFTVGTILFSVDVHRQARWQHAQLAIHGATTATVACALVLLAADLAGVYHGVAERTYAVALSGWVVTVAWGTFTRST